MSLPVPQHYVRRLPMQHLERDVQHIESGVVLLKALPSKTSVTFNRDICTPNDPGTSLLLTESDSQATVASFRIGSLVDIYV